MIYRSPYGHGNHQRQGQHKHGQAGNPAPPQRRMSPHVLAAYFSDARLNILACLNDVRVKTGPSPVDDEGENVSALDSLSLRSAKPEDQKARMRLLRERFPFLNPMTDPNLGEPDASRTEAQDKLSDEKLRQLEEKAEKRAQEVHEVTPADYDRCLRRLFRLVHNLRNALVHPGEEPATLTPNDYKYLFLDLGKVYDGSRRTLATRFGLDAAVMKPLLRHGKDGKVMSYGQFPLAIGKDPESLKAHETTAPVQAMDVLQDFGLVLLCALFLEKSQSAELIAYFWQAGYAADWNQQQQAIVKELIAVYRMRLPMQRLRSDESAAAITLDTLSELSRCPKLLFDALDEQHQQIFRTGTSPNAPQLDATTGGDTDDPEASYLMVRQRDRFVPLMMRLLDLDPKSPLRFAVDLGQYFFNVRLKPGDAFTDQRPRVRRLGRKVVGYGRLRDFLDADKPATWAQLEDNYRRSAEDADRAEAHASDEVQPLKPYIVQTEPHYHFYDDRIGIRLAKPDNVATYPRLPAEVAQANTEDCVLKGVDMEPEFWLSPAQMLHLAFYTFLQRRDGRCLTPDVLLRRYRGGTQKLLLQLAQGVPLLDGAPGSAERRAAAQRWIDGIFSVGSKDDSPEVYLGELPEVVTRALLGADGAGVVATTIDTRIGHLIKDSEERIKRLDAMLQGFKKRGKPGFEPVKAGPAAVFLTEDLLRFQPIDPKRLDAGGGKINSQQYQILEAALAYYAIHVNEPPRIVDLLRNSGLLDGPMRHPFLNQLGPAGRPNQFEGILDFYRAYLRARIGFLEQERARLARAPVPIQPPRWLRLRQSSSLDTWLAGFQDEDGSLLPEPHALPVPANLLYRPILVAVARALGTTPDALLEKGSRQVGRGGQTVTIRPAVTWLLQHYLAQQGDAAQAMYGYARSHELFDDCLDDRKKEHLAKERRPLSHVERREAMQRILQGRRGPNWKRIDDEKVHKLRDAYRRRERRIRYMCTQDMALFLHSSYYFEHHVRLPAGAAKPIWHLKDIEHTLMNTAIDVELPVPNKDRALRHPGCKVRNLGELGLLVRDKRLPSLLDYYPASETLIDQAEIRAELVSYRRIRVRAMNAIYRLEQAIASTARGTRPDEIPSGERATFGSGRHGKRLYQLRQLWRQQAAPNAAAATVAAFGDDRFRQVLELRNAICHNQYPHPDFFGEVAAAVAQEPIPTNPANHRRIAERLFAAMESLYAPWCAFLKCPREELKHV